MRDDPAASDDAAAPDHPVDGQPPGGEASSSSLRSRAALSTYSTVVQGAARLLFSVLVARLGSRELLGQTNSALSLAVLSNQLWSFPAATAGVRYVALRKTLGDDAGAAVVARHIATRTALVSLLIPTSAALVGAFVLDFEPTLALGTLGLAWVYSIYVTVRGTQFGFLRFRHVAVWDTVAAATTIVLTVVVLLLDLTPLTLLPLIVGYGVFAVMSWPRRVRQRVDAGLRREIDRFILFGAVAGVASGGLLQASQLAAQYFTGASGAGDFAAALSLATPASMLSVALSTVLVPPLVAAAGRGDTAAVRRHGDAILRRLSTIFVGIFGVLIVVSPLGIAVIYGKELSAAAELLPILLLAVMFTSIALGATTTLTSTRRRGPRAVALLNVTGLVVSCIAWALLGPDHGTTGVAVGYLVGSGVTSVGLVVTVWVVERQHWWGLTARVLAGTALAVGLAVVTRGVPGLTGAVVQVLAAAVFALAWLVLCREDVRALWATVRGREHPAGVG